MRIRPASPPPGHPESGGSAGISVDLEENLKVYYEKRGWDWDTGFPSKETLEKLEILKSKS